MNNQTDQQLLRDYAERRSETAFAELVRRHVDFAYSAALRMVRNTHLAEDVTQSVFVALAQNARRLADRPVLSGWLHRTTQNLAANAIRSDVRRRVREQEAAAMKELLSAEPDAIWDRIAPHLDAALGELNETERDALLLRYFERKSAQEMAQVLGVSDRAAQKRVSRAVERLREFFAKRGLTVGASGLVVVISANAVQAAPLELAVSVTAAAVKGTAVTASTLTLVTGAMKFMAWAKLKTAFIGAVILAGVVTTSVVIQQRAASTTMASATKEHPYTNSLGMKFVPVPGTKVLFSVWDTRVKDFEVFVNETGYDATEGVSSVRSDGWKKRGDSWHSPGFPQSPEHPVCGVNWFDAKEFCQWLSKREGKTYRLPTDAEWSYAVGIGDQESGETPQQKSARLRDVYPWGSSMPPMVNGKPMGNYGGEDTDDGNWALPRGVSTLIAGYRDNFARTSAVGSFPANALGLYDMGGNVWQWCEDIFVPGEERRVWRGGGWFSVAPWILRSAFRDGRPPHERSLVGGFRVVLTEQPPR